MTLAFVVAVVLVVLAYGLAFLAARSAWQPRAQAWARSHPWLTGVLAAGFGAVFFAVERHLRGAPIKDYLSFLVLVPFVALIWGILFTRWLDR